MKPTQIIQLGGIVPLSSPTTPAEESTVPVVALTGDYHGTTVVRLAPQTLAQAEGLTLKHLGITVSEHFSLVGKSRVQAIGFPAWPIINDPDNAQHALNLVADVEWARKMARSQTKKVWERFEEITIALNNSAPHFVPTLLEELARAFDDAGATKFATRAFSKAREVERSYNLTIDNDRHRHMFLEFARRGVISAKEITAEASSCMLHRAFQIDNVVGLTQVLAGDATVADAVQMTGTRDLLLMPSGRIPPNPSELVGSHRMQRLIEALAVDYTVIIDAPPLLPVTDAGLLTKASDGALLVVAVGKTFKEQLRLATKLLGQINGHLLGSVLNLAPKRGLGAVVYGYGNGNYGQSYSSYESEPEKEELPQVPAVRPIPATPVARTMPAAQPGHRPSATPPEDTAPVSDSPAWPPRRAIAG